MPPSDERFDVFISYKSENLAWVETLARNLQAQTLTAWLDEWLRVPREPIARSLDQALATHTLASWW